MRARKSTPAPGWGGGALLGAQLRTIRGRLHDGIADATIETMDAMFARMLRRLTEFVRRGGSVH